jgi:tetratricopeptide (TPR) repeat protein
VSLNSLAVLYDNQAKYEQAEPLYQESLRIIQETVGENSLEAATGYSNLGKLYYSQGKYEQAMFFYQKALKINESLNLDNAQFIANLHNFAKLYQVQGKYKEALPLCERALAIAKNILNEEDPVYKRVYENYLSLLEEMKQTQA